jgi:hypothetical protein
VFECYAEFFDGSFPLGIAEHAVLELAKAAPYLVRSQGFS